VDIGVGDVVITDDEARWRVYSLTSHGPRRSFVALHLSSPTVLAGDLANLTWSETESAWRFKAPGAAT
jgi:hypothetical protein